MQAQPRSAAIKILPLFFQIPVFQAHAVIDFEHVLPLVNAAIARPERIPPLPQSPNVFVLVARFDRLEALAALVPLPGRSRFRPDTSRAIKIA